jgi:hypothetical protein
MLLSCLVQHLVFCIYKRNLEPASRQRIDEKFAHDLNSLSSEIFSRIFEHGIQIWRILLCLVCQSWNVCNVIPSPTTTSMGGRYPNDDHVGQRQLSYAQLTKSF